MTKNRIESDRIGSDSESDWFRLIVIKKVTGVIKKVTAVIKKVTMAFQKFAVIDSSRTGYKEWPKMLKRI